MHELSWVACSLYFWAAHVYQGFTLAEIKAHLEPACLPGMH